LTAAAGGADPRDERAHLAFPLAFHLRCPREDVTDPNLSSLERLALVRERVAGVREIRRALAAMTADLR
jgi:hypothetical protein